MLVSKILSVTPPINVPAFYISNGSSHDFIDLLESIKLEFTHNIVDFLKTVQEYGLNGDSTRYDRYIQYIRQTFLFNPASYNFISACY